MQRRKYFLLCIAILGVLCVRVAAVRVKAQHAPPTDKKQDGAVVVRLELDDSFHECPHQQQLSTLRAFVADTLQQLVHNRAMQAKVKAGILQCHTDEEQYGGDRVVTTSFAVSISTSKFRSARRRFMQQLLDAGNICDVGELAECAKARVASFEVISSDASPKSVKMHTSGVRKHSQRPGRTPKPTSKSHGHHPKRSLAYPSRSSSSSTTYGAGWTHTGGTQAADGDGGTHGSAGAHSRAEHSAGGDGHAYSGNGGGEYGDSGSDGYDSSGSSREGYDYLGSGRDGYATHLDAPDAKHAGAAAAASIASAQAEGGDEQDEEQEEQEEQGAIFAGPVSWARKVTSKVSRRAVAAAKAAAKATAKATAKAALLWGAGAPAAQSAAAAQLASKQQR